MPLSLAIFLAKGEAKILPPVLVVEEVSRVFSIVSIASTVVVLGSIFESLEVKLPSLWAATIVETSVPFGPMILNKLSTLALSPSAIPTYNNTPS